MDGITTGNEYKDFHECAICCQIFHQWSELQDHQIIHIENKDMRGIDFNVDVSKDKYPGFRLHDQGEQSDVRLHTKSMEDGGNGWKSDVSFKMEKREDAETSDNEGRSDDSLHMENNYDKQDSERGSDVTCSLQTDKDKGTKLDIRLHVDKGNGDIKKKLDDSLNMENMDTSNNVGKSTDPLRMEYKVDNRDQERNLEINLHTETKVDNGGASDDSDVCLKERETGDIDKYQELISIPDLPITSNKSWNLKCDFCNKIFNDQANLQEHARVHQGNRPFNCDYCWKTFPRQTDRLRHLVTHTGEKPHHCDVCNKSFNLHSNLMKHKKIHTGEKPFECGMCDKSFSQCSNLLTHMKTHTGEKPFSCDICGKSFCRQSDVNRHYKTHTGDKPFKCDLCGKSFSDGSNLQKHATTHTGEKPFSCEVCGRSFSRRSTVKRHLSTHTHDSRGNHSPSQLSTQTEDSTLRENHSPSQPYHNNVGENQPNISESNSLNSKISDNE